MLFDGGFHVIHILHKSDASKVDMKIKKNLWCRMLSSCACACLHTSGVGVSSGHSGGLCV